MQRQNFTFLPLSRYNAKFALEKDAPTFMNIEHKEQLIILAAFQTLRNKTCENNDLPKKHV